MATQNTQPLDVLIIGAGIAGLCTGIGFARSGHNVTILEAAQKLSPVGGGLHVPPNATLVLQRWGILDRFRDIAIEPKGFTFRRYKDSRVLASTSIVGASDKISTPYWAVKRCDYQRVLYEVAVELGVTVQLGRKVLEVDCDAPAVYVNGDSGRKSIEADLVVVADGMRSRLRQQILPNEDVSPILQPYETYRGWAPTSAFDDHEDVKKLFESPSSNVWIGPGRHVIFYPAAHGEMLTINGTHPPPVRATREELTEWNRSVSVADIQHSFSDFDPLVKRILGEAKDCKAYTLAEVPRLSSWLAESGKVVLMGDAAHGMLQFLAQGAAMAVEDAAALAECVDGVVRRKGGDVKNALRLFEKVRKGRCERVQSEARRNGECIHMADGTMRELRDRKLGGEDMQLDENVDTGPFFDEEFKQWLYGYDVFEDVKEKISLSIDP